ncbi:MAG: J domain-containing protein, partial [Haloferacaceae archaeon]|nr:J domain-containing protein [Haloferacaceae archaeon]
GSGSCVATCGRCRRRCGRCSSRMRAAYRAAVREHHPDRPDGDRARFAALQRAYAVLSEEG